jgi:hypothetical protein
MAAKQKRTAAMKSKQLVNSLNPKDGLWVELETNKGEDHIDGGVKLTCSYRGLLSVSDFKRLLKHSSDTSFVKLERVYWIDGRVMEEGQLRISPVRFGHDYIYRNFLGPLFLRINQIVAIAPIDGKEDMKWMKMSVCAEPSVDRKKRK